MSVATASATIEVSAQETMVQTATSDLSTTINQQLISSMPLLTRNVFDLAFAAPGVTQGMNFNAAAGGARESGTTYMLNGADNNDNFSEGSYNITPPLESVQEFTMLTNNMSAQYGHASGALVSAVQKSGTNTFHGVGYEFNRNRSFNASDFFANRACESQAQIHPQPVRRRGRRAHHQRQNVLLVHLRPAGPAAGRPACRAGSHTQRTERDHGSGRACVKGFVGHL